MFLLRTAFWLSLVILLLPAEEAPKGVHQAAYSQSGLDAGTVIGAAQATFNDIAGICERSPAVCATGRAALDVFKRKALYGAHRIMEMLGGDGNAGGSVVPGEPAAVAPQPAGDREAAVSTRARARPTASQHTLQPADMEPVWNEPIKDRPV